MIQAKQVQQIAVITADDPAQLQDRINAELLVHTDVIDLAIDENQNKAIIKYLVDGKTAARSGDQIPDASGSQPDFYLSLVDPTAEAADTAVVDVRLIVPVSENSCCADCDNYIWGVRCRYTGKRVDRVHDVCPMENVTIQKHDVLATSVRNKGKTKV